MAKKIIWTSKALVDYRKILIYWKERNKSSAYSLKLSYLIDEALRLVAINPEIGRKADNGNARVKIVRDYHIIYEDEPESITVLMIWDNRRDPDQFGKQLKKRK